MNRNHLFSAIIFSLLSLLVACSSTEQKKTDELKAYITKEIEISVPKAKFDTEESFDQLLSTTYNGKKSSLLVSSVIKKNSISVTGLTPGYLKLFTLTYDESGINAEYSVPKAMLPPINQVLLDIMLSYKNNLNHDLPKEFRIIDKGNERTISYVDITKMRKVIYKIEYKSMNGKRLPNKIINFEFNYTINFKYV
ncbi:MAG: DUF3261 domain-containing protein [Succinivibrio sp.]|nr:DUF3261 domain-containing protein [Succinatimonas sp.]MDY6246733.1 DUF3261 domain-containing protein [Succinivibrio sp.]MDY6261115.1 DUF3261 domain-containing protein [Succinivibrio sp.]